jgi:hypothetical protein
MRQSLSCMCYLSLYIYPYGYSIKLISWMARFFSPGKTEYKTVHAIYATIAMTIIISELYFNFYSLVIGLILLLLRGAVESEKE